ncbi:alpha/beta fold hydrolase [Streptomyces sp. NPDC057702]
MAQIPVAQAALSDSSPSTRPGAQAEPAQAPVGSAVPGRSAAAPARVADSASAASGPAPIGPLATRVTGAGPGLLLAHGAGGSVKDNFVPILPALAAGHTVVASDYPGAGETPRSTTPLHLDGLADAVVAEAVAAGVETFTLVGYSLGSAVAVRAATRHPERVRGLVLTAGLARADNRARTTLALWLRLLALEDRRAFAELVALTGFAPATYQGLAADALEPLLADIAASVPPGTPEHAALVLEVDTVADLPRVSVPTLVIATTADLLVDPANSRVLADAIPGAEYAELDTGHVPMVERPAEWADLITDFLARHGL